MGSLRLVTIHPLLVHLTVGALPVMVLAYVLAARRRSEAWTFVGDAIAGISAMLGVATVVFGFVANARLPDVAGLGPWRWAHAAAGVLTAALLAALALGRLRPGVRGRTSGGTAVALAASVAVSAGLTGWLGGGVLVFRSGLAVQAAAEGVLSPRVPIASAPSPRTLSEVMGRLRGAWATATTELALMLVVAPTERGFAIVAHEADRIGALAPWVSTDWGQGPALRPGDHAPPAGVDRLKEAATALGTAARAQNLAAANAALGAVGAACAACHAERRWQRGLGEGAAPTE